jgi:hypothetical protein
MKFSGLAIRGILAGLMLLANASTAGVPANSGRFTWFGYVNGDYI